MTAHFSNDNYLIHFPVITDQSIFLWLLTGPIPYGIQLTGPLFSDNRLVPFPMVFSWLVPYFSDNWLVPFPMAFSWLVPYSLITDWSHFIWHLVDWSHIIINHFIHSHIHKSSYSLITGWSHFLLDSWFIAPFVGLEICQLYGSR